MKVCIDAGHGGKDSGAVGLEAKEKNIVLSISLKLEQLLKKHSHSAVLTRRKDTYPTLKQRSAFANIHKADVFVSIHCNGAASFRAEGIETFCGSSGSKESKRYRKQVQNELIKVFPTHRNRGEKSANFSVLRRTKMPAILVECEFITNPNQEAFLINSAVQQVFAEAIFQGLTSSTIVRKPKKRIAIKKQWKKPTISKPTISKPTKRVRPTVRPQPKSLTFWQRIKKFFRDNQEFHNGRNS